MIVNAEKERAPYAASQTTSLIVFRSIPPSIRRRRDLRGHRDGKQ